MREIPSFDAVKSIDQKRDNTQMTKKDIKKREILVNLNFVPLYLKKIIIE